MTRAISVDPRIFQLVALSRGLQLYAATGIKPNRAWTPSAMMGTAERLTGLSFPPRGYLQAARALDIAAAQLKEKLDNEHATQQQSIRSMNPQAVRESWIVIDGGKPTE